MSKGGRPAQLNGIQHDDLRQRLRHRSVEAQAGARGDSASLWRAVQRSGCVAAAGQAGLFQPEARAPRHSARGGGRRALEELHLAGAKEQCQQEGP